MSFRFKDPTELIAASEQLAINYSVFDVAANYNELKNKEFVVIDTETTGFDGEIIEIGAVIIKD